MRFLQLTLLFAVLCIGAFAAKDNKAILDCINSKYEADLGESYKTCYDNSRHLRIQKIKDCYQQLMKDAQVVVTKKGQMTVDRTSLGTWADANSNKNVGRAMKTCYNSNPEGSDLYKEAARLSQCVFQKVKETCN